MYCDEVRYISYQPPRENGIFLKMFSRLMITQKGSSVAHSPYDIYSASCNMHH